MRGVGAQRLVSGLEDRGRRRIRNRRHALDQFRQRHRHAVDRHRQPALECDLETRRFVQLRRARRPLPQRRLEVVFGAGVHHGGGAFDTRDLVERARDERTHGRFLVPGQRHDAVAGELVARVDHVRAHRARRERRLTDAFQLARLADVERHGDDVGLELGGEAWNGCETVGTAGAGDDDVAGLSRCRA